MSETKASVKLFDILAKIVAVLYVLVLAIEIFNGVWPFIKGEHAELILKIFFYTKMYAGLALAGLVVMEFAMGRNFIIKIIILALLAVIVIASFFSDTWGQIVDFVNKTALGK
ncbi:MAG: hypothetical protein RR248_04130 [Clostridia bacterium]